MYFLLGSLLIFFALTFGEGQTEADVNFSVTEGYSNTFVGDLKNSTYMKNKFDKPVLDNMEFNLLDVTMFKLSGGVIRTAEDIDREQLSQCILREQCFVTFDATYSGPEDLVGGVTVSVEIVDINDYTPTFDPDTITLTISEGSPLKSSRSLDLAVDLDSPQHGVKRYELASSTNTFKLVTEEKSGLVLQFSGLRLVLEEELDREKIASYQLHILAYDTIAGDESVDKGILTITVQVSDDNDSEPKFTEESYEIDIAEDTAPIKSLLTVKATDEDEGANAEVSYTWSHKTQNSFGELFRIHEETGDVYLIGSLDYEERTEYTLNVVASDHGIEPQTSTTDIIIHVIDQNDNSPQITINIFGPESSAKLSEFTPEGSLVAQVTVSDRDSGNNGDIICSLPHPAFTLQSQPDAGYSFKVVTAQPLDREVQELYALHITCTDQGEEQNQETKTLVVTVIDENDNRPELPRAQYVAYVYENNAVGDVLVSINATDKDVGANGELRYEVSKGEITKLISVDEKTGVVTANAVFDYESIKEIKFDMVIKDGGTPSYEITTTITIHIKDRNDERPTFDKDNYTINIQENNEPHVYVGRVSASDKDDAPFNSFTYSISEDYPDVPFYIHTETGEIFASNSFDRETKDFYLFVVMAIDANEPYFTSEANVLISIQDSNDNSPRIVFPPVINSTFTISNKLPIGTAVLTVQVSDADSGMNANCTFRMQEVVVDGKVAFTISPSGTIITSMDFSELDYQSFELVIYVQDRGSPPMSTSQKVVINVDSTVSEASTGKESGGNLSIIIAVTVVSIAIVAILVTAILLIKLRERRRKSTGQNKDVEPYNIDRSDIIDSSKSTNDSQAEQGKTNQAYVIDPGVPVSYNPLPPESRSRSVSPDSSMHEMKLDKVKAQKQYLAAMTGVLDHDTSSSGSTDDSGRGPSEEGGEYILRHSPLNDSSDPVPNDTYTVPHKKPSLKPSSSNHLDSVNKNQVNTKPQDRIPPSYDSHMRRKTSSRQKKVEFDLTEKAVQHYHSTGDLRSELTDPESPDHLHEPHREHYIGERCDNYTPPLPPRAQKQQTYDDMGFVFMNHHKNKLEPVHSRSHSYQDLITSKRPAVDNSRARNVEGMSRTNNGNDVAMASIVV